MKRTITEKIAREKGGLPVRRVGLHIRAATVALGPAAGDDTIENVRRGRSTMGISTARKVFHRWFKRGKSVEEIKAVYVPAFIREIEDACYTTNPPKRAA